MSLAAFPLSTAFTADLAPEVIVKAPLPEPGWYFYGGFEAGVRFYLEHPPTGFGRAPPPDNWLTPQTTDSIAKFEEYGKIPQTAPFLDWINLQAGTQDGRYALDFWGRSVGLNNQSYSLDASAIGQHYLSLGWDQTPHLISTSAKNLFGGVGTTSLTVANSIQAALQAQMPNASANTPAGAAARAAIENIINNNLTSLELSTRRDKATVDYQYTPNAAWTFQVDHSNEHRTGVRPLGVSWGFNGGFASNAIEVPAAINDRTQNVNAGGEYFGTTFFGTRWNTNVRYAGSFYENENKLFTAENPFCLNTCFPTLLLMPMQPNNQANGVVWNTGVDLPWFKGRFMSTFQFNHMTQDDPFISTATNGFVPAPIRTLGGVPVSSLNGVVNTFLWNNVLTAHLTNDLKLVVKGRHYDIDNQTPMLQTTNYNRADSGLVTQTRRSLPIAYTKDNASTELNYRPARWLNVGGGWYWERWDRKLRDVNVTNENMGKVFADATLANWALWRGSYLYSQRRYGEYSTEHFVEDVALAFSEVASNMRRFDVANRNRHKADTAFEFAVYEVNTTITPNAGLRWDDYPDPVFNPLGLQSDHSWNAGIEVSTTIQPTIRVMAAYTYEDRKLDITGGTGGANFGTLPLGCPTAAAANPDAIIGPICTWGSDIHQRNHTFLAAVDWKVIPTTFDLRLEYLYSRGSEANATAPCSVPGAAGFSCNGLVAGANPALVNFGQFPTERNILQRFNVIGRYYVDPFTVRQMGFEGDITIKVRYTWERNRNENWAYDNLTPYVPTADPGQPEISGGSRSLFLAAFNPNYNAHLIAASTVVKW
jgi:MtrB/PioB family decaheme-associated outer membrane protein